MASAFSRPLDGAPRASKTITTTGSGSQDLTLTVGTGTNKTTYSPQYGVVTVVGGAGAVHIDYEDRAGDGFTAFQGMVVGGGCTSLDDANCDAGTEIVFYY